MDRILEDILKSRRLKQQYEMYAATAQQYTPPFPQIGQVAGRDIKRVDGVASAESKETRLYQSHVMSSNNDQLSAHRVNSWKKIESNSNNPLFRHNAFCGVL